MRVPTALYQKVTFTAMALGVLAIAPTNASATPIPLGGGAVLNISNLVGTLVGVSNTCINWGYPAACSINTAVQDTVSGSDAAVFTVGSTPLDTIRDLPLAFITPVVDFETVQSPLAGGVVHFDLTSIVIPGAFGNCASSAVNTVCNPGNNSPFTLIQETPTQVGILLAINANAYTGTSASGTTPYNAIFTTQLSGVLNNNAPVTIPNILALIASGGTVSATWSATESPISAVPEPSQFLLLGSGLVGLGLWKSRRLGNRS